MNTRHAEQQGFRKSIQQKLLLGVLAFLTQVERDGFSVTQ